MFQDIVNNKSLGEYGFQIWTCLHVFIRGVVKVCQSLKGGFKGCIIFNIQEIISKCLTEQ